MMTNWKVILLEPRADRRSKDKLLACHLRKGHQASKSPLPPIAKSVQYWKPLEKFSLNPIVNVSPRVDNIECQANEDRRRELCSSPPCVGHSLKLQKRGQWRECQTVRVLKDSLSINFTPSPLLSLYRTLLLTLANLPLRIGPYCGHYDSPQPDTYRSLKAGLGFR